MFQKRKRNISKEILKLFIENKTNYEFFVVTHGTMSTISVYEVLSQFIGYEIIVDNARICHPSNCVSNDADMQSMPPLEK